ncbi:MAG: phosphopantothenoylcysteine decarboxylase [Alphaproteobacteria bacterium]|nr:phosphopantothenoylcysteine decarboxylase [Alphaproteobacteria bacterium]
MACGEYGVGRLASTHAIAQVVAQHATGNTARYATGNMAQHATGNMAQYATGDAAQYATQDAAQPAETVPLARNSMAHPALPVDSPDSVEQVVVPPLPQPQPAADGLKGLHALVTAGPTHEAIDPVRYISNASSGKQGFAVAEALANQGATVTLISGPVTLPTPAGVTRVDVTSALEMDSAVAQRLPCDIAVFVAAVADWHVPAPARDKLKKSDTSIATFPQTNTDEQAPPPRQFSLKLVETPDLLHTYSRHAQRPKLVIGFCLETANVETNAVAKWRKKQCDWMVVNALTADNRVFNANDNRAGILREYPADQPAPASHPSVDWWPKSSKQAIAERLVIQIVQWHEQQRQPS